MKTDKSYEAEWTLTYSLPLHSYPPTSVFQGFIEILIDNDVNDDNKHDSVTPSGATRCLKYWACITSFNAQNSLMRIRSPPFYS